MTMSQAPQVLPPLKSIRKYCISCCIGLRKEISDCPGSETTPVCPLWLLRFGKGVKGVSPLKSIRAKCLDCSGGGMAEVRRCMHTDCQLYPFRMGHNPNLKGKRGKRSESTAKHTPISPKSLNQGRVIPVTAQGNSQVYGR